MSRFCRTSVAVALLLLIAPLVDSAPLLFRLSRLTPPAPPKPPVEQARKPLRRAVPAPADTLGLPGIVLPEMLLAPGDTDPRPRRYDGRGDDWMDSPYDASRRNRVSPLYGPRPTAAQTIYELAPDGKGYYVYERVGKYDLRPPTYMTREEYGRMRLRQQSADYFRRKAETSATQGNSDRLVPALNINSGLFKDIFGSGRVDIRPNITALLDLSSRTNRLQNPSLSLRQQENTFFDFRQQIQMNVTGQIGERLRFRANYDTEAQFNFENQFKVEYVGQEDDVLRTLEAGNVSLPLNGTLITGGQNLWGVKLGFQFGPVSVTGVVSQQRGKTNEITIRPGTANTEFLKKASEYDDYRHFFLNQYFRSLYESSLANPPLVLSPINVTRVEVWVSNFNASSTAGTRNAVGFVDLGEGRNASTYGPRLFNAALTPASIFADNNSNQLYSLVRANPATRDNATTTNALEALPGLSLRGGADFELTKNLRRLNESEYYLHPQLGFLSLSIKLQPNQVLFVAYEYTVKGDPTVHRVGEFSNDVPADGTNSNVLFLKMLKPSAVRPVLNNRPYPAWDLMMKNVYSLVNGTIAPENFRLDVVYESFDGKGDINYLPTGAVANRPLIQLLALDRLTNNRERGPDNRFDWLPGISIIPERGVIMFPVLEPFGEYLGRQIASPTEDSLYTFRQLYRQTQADAIYLSPRQDRFKFRGTYTGQAGGTEVFLNTALIVPGSVRVTAGAGVLVEGVDYTVDYQIGKVTLLGRAMQNTSQEISIKWESNTLFGIDQKTLVGARIDYRVNRYLNLGGTVLYLNERPLINKVVIGEEPMSNLLWGLDGTYNRQSRWITRLLDKLPWYSTSAPSQVNITGEFAQLRPGFPSQIATSEEQGIAYIDDFEGAQNALDLASQVQNWVLASVPPTIPDPDPGSPDSLRRGFTRARLAWYQIDSRFFDQPQDFGLSRTGAALNDNYQRRISINEVFPGRTVAVTDFLQTFDLQYQPTLRGQYNYAAAAARLNPDGTLRNPQDNWGGIMRRTTGNTDFEAANFEFLEFWVMDPFMSNPTSVGGDLYFNLGKVSEDILPDNRLSFENGLPTNALNNAANTNLVTTPWGRVPALQASTNAFDNDPAARQFQDVGLDGLGAADEAAYFGTFLSAAAAAGLSPDALAQLQADPSSDNFQFFADGFPSGTDILTRYRLFNGLEGNSPVSQGADGFSRASKLLPDIEDLNQDGTPNTTESFWEYRISMRPSDLVVGQNHIVDKQIRQVNLPNGTRGSATWYLFRIPIRTAGTARLGIQDFKAIDFIRMYLTQFNDPVVLRFGSLRLVSTQWRTYPTAFKDDGMNGGTGSEFALGTLNVEENTSKSPFPYTVPPRIQRQGVPSSPIPNQLQNEQALQLKVQNLADGESHAVFKNVQLDLRFYDRIRMWVHAEGIAPTLNNIGDARIFVRLGTDYLYNYYEYEIPLTPSALGAASPEAIWPTENELNVRFDDLAAAKVQRNAAGQAFNQRYTITTPDGRRITVLGNPLLNNVKTVMVGIRNPSDPSAAPLSVEVWVNELRVTDYNLEPGWAAAGRMNLRLADLGTLQLSGQYVTPGFGSVEKRVFERTLDYRKQWDIATTLQLGRLLPKKLGLEIPVAFSYGERLIEPKYNPVDPDIRLSTFLENTPADRRDVAYAQSVTYNRNISYSLNNVRRIRQGTGKAQIWDIENWAFSYSFAEVFTRSAQIERRIQQQQSASVVFQHGFSPKNYRPFKGKSNKSNLLTEFNFFLLPQTISFSVNADRQYEEEKLRAVAGTNFLLPATYVQNFTITRRYDVRWDLTRSLGLTYSGTDIARVDEPRGPADSPAKRDSLWANVVNVGRTDFWNWLNFGRTIDFTQTVTATYRVPFQYVAPLNWFSSTLGYTADYKWVTAPLQSQSLGNTITNSRTLNGDFTIDFAKFYKKFPAIDRIRKPIPRRNIYSEADSLRRRGDDVGVAFRNFGKGMAGTLFSLQQVELRYTRTDGTTLPGFLPGVDLFGIDMDYTDPSTGEVFRAPGFDFVFGGQPSLTREGFFAIAIAKGWVSKDPRLAAQFGQTSNEQITGRTALEPFRGLRIDLNLQRTKTSNLSGVFAFDQDQADFLISNRISGGTYTITTVGAHTLFGGDRFAEFQAARVIISDRLRAQNGGYLGSPISGQLADGTWNGYTGSSQEVLIPALLAAYGPYSVGGVPLSGFPEIPLPNWSVQYNGLSDLWFMKTIFKTVTLTHRYTGTYSASFLENLNAQDLNNDGFIDNFEAVPADTTQKNFLPRNVVQSVLISESFAPLLGINLVFQNGISLLLDYKQSRTLLLNTGALQLTETNNTEFTFNLAWKKDRPMMPISIFGQLIELRNNFTVRVEMTFRDAKTENRRLDSTIEREPTGGNSSWTFKPSIDYVISDQLTARAYYERTSNRPVLSNSFPTVFIAWGIQLRFTLK